MYSSPQSPASSIPAISADAPLADGQLMLRLARELADRSDTGHPARTLAGRNLALVAEEDDPSANMFCLAALDLGAHVSHIRPALTVRSDPDEIRQTARVLGKLYAALEWPGIAPTLMEQLRKEAEIPVFDGISQPHHPLAGLAEQLDIQASIDTKWRLLIQALLLRALQ